MRTETRSPARAMSCESKRRLPVTFGTPVQQLAVGGFHITEATYAADFALPVHEHAHGSWTLVLGGAFEEVFAGDTIRCVAGSVLAKPASAAHSNRYGPCGARVLLVEIKEASAAIGRMANNLLGRVAWLRPGSARSLVRRLHGELATRDRGSELATHALLLQIATLLVRREDRRKKMPRDQWLSAARDRLHAEFACPPSLEVLAHGVGIHPVYLCEVFRARFGCSPGEYVRGVRLQVARSALERTDDPISSIAFAAGYSDQSHMCREFRAALGVTPVAYRRDARGS